MTGTLLSDGGVQTPSLLFKGGKKMTKRTTTTKPKAQKATQKDQGFLGIAPYEEKKGEEYMNANQLTHFRNL